MLILSRRVGESIVIGDQVSILIQSVKGKQVRIGIDAPPEIIVLRKELVDHVSPENPDSTNSDE